MIEYLVDGVKYGFDYQELKQTYRHFARLTDEEFVADINNVLHFAVHVAWIKGLQARHVLSDRGVIHELIHLLSIEEASERSRDVRQVRILFDREMALV